MKSESFRVHCHAHVHTIRLGPPVARLCHPPKLILTAVQLTKKKLNCCLQMSINRRDTAPPAAPAAPPAPPAPGDEAAVAAAAAAAATAAAGTAMPGMGQLPIKRKRSLREYLEYSTRACRRARGGDVDVAPPDGPTWAGDAAAAGDGSSCQQRRQFDTVVRCQLEGTPLREAVVGRGVTQCAVQVSLRFLFTFLAATQILQSARWRRSPCACVASQYP
jgi:hypothetical protein